MWMPAVASEGKLYERERIEILRIDFCGTVSAQQMVFEEDAYLGTIAVPSGCLAAAISMEVIRFSFPSVRNMPMGSWLPVR